MEITRVLGAIAPEALGLTSMQEHILCDSGVYRRRYEKDLPAELPVTGDDPVSLANIGLHRRNFIITKDGMGMRDEEVMAAELNEFKASGGSAMVEMSTPGLRCDIRGIRRLAEASGVRVVATTGLYTEDSWPEKYTCMTLEDYASHMRDEIQNGIEDTGIKPGHIKIAIGDLTRNEEWVLRAAARVAMETGLSVTIHPGDSIGSDGRRIVKILKEEGMDLSRVVIAHGDYYLSEHDLKTLVLFPESWRLRLDYAKELLDQGVNLAFDLFGQYYALECRNFVLEQDWQRLAGVVALIQAGYSPEMVLGTHTFLKILTRRFGGEGYCRLTKFVLPKLKEFGVSDYDIRRMTVENPASLLAH